VLPPYAKYLAESISHGQARGMTRIPKFLAPFNSTALVPTISPLDAPDKQRADSDKRNRETRNSVFHVQHRPGICCEHVESRLVHSLRVHYSHTEFFLRHINGGTSTSIVLTGYMHDFTDFTVNGGVEPVVVCGCESEDGYTGSDKHFSCIRIRFHVEEIRDVKVAIFDPDNAWDGDRQRRRWVAAQISLAMSMEG
jgi:hypothetical protein